MTDDWTSDASLDLTGMLCPLPVLAVRKQLLGMAPGRRISVETTDPMALVDIPHFCAEAGHRLIARDAGEDSCRFLIERG